MLPVDDSQVAQSLFCYFFHSLKPVFGRIGGLLGSLLPSLHVLNFWPQLLDNLKGCLDPGTNIFKLFFAEADVFS